MSTNAITSANAAQAIVKLIAARGLPALVGSLMMGRLVNRNYEADMNKSGDTVNVPIPPIMKSNNLAEGGSVQLQNPSLGNAQVVLNHHDEASFQIPDVTSLLVGDVMLLDQYMTPAIIGVAEGIETAIFNVYPGFTFNSAVGAPGVALTESVIDSAETTLFNAKVPEATPKFLVVDGTGYSDLRQIERFSEVRMNGDGAQAINNGMLGTIKKFNVFRSQYVPITGSGTTTTHALAFAPDAITLVTRQLPQPIQGTGAIAEYVSMGGFGMRVVMSYNPQTLSQQFTIDVLYGVSVLRNQFAVPVNY